MQMKWHVVPVLILMGTLQIRICQSVLKLRELRRTGARYIADSYRTGRRMSYLQSLCLSVCSDCHTLSFDTPLPHGHHPLVDGSFICMDSVAHSAELSINFLRNNNNKKIISFSEADSHNVALPPCQLFLSKCCPRKY